jgi:hypothetical protein
VDSCIEVTNLSPETLSASSNAATVHAIVYEDAHVGVTDRFARASVQGAIAQLAPGAVAKFELQTPDLNNVNWAKLHFVAVVDYRPGGSVGAFDMLQAAVTPIYSGPFVAQPDTYTFMIDPSDPVVPQRPVRLEGLPDLSWTAVADAPWLTVTPSGGLMTDVPMLSVIRDQLSAGWQQGSVTFTAEDGLYSDQVIVRAYLGPVERAYLPVVQARSAE